MDPELQKRNVRLGLLLFLIFLVIFAGAFATALIYLHFD
jgi:hypothetical protein